MSKTKYWSEDRYAFIWYWWFRIHLYQVGTEFGTHPYPGTPTLALNKSPFSWNVCSDLHHALLIGAFTPFVFQSSTPASRGGLLDTRLTRTAWTTWAWAWAWKSWMAWCPTNTNQATTRDNTQININGQSCSTCFGGVINSHWLLETFRRVCSCRTLWFQIFRFFVWAVILYRWFWFAVYGNPLLCYSHHCTTPEFLVVMPTEQ